MLFTPCLLLSEYVVCRPLTKVVAGTCSLEGAVEAPAGRRWVQHHSPGHHLWRALLHVWQVGRMKDAYMGGAGCNACISASLPCCPSKVGTCSATQPAPPLPSVHWPAWIWEVQVRTWCSAGLTKQHIAATLDGARAGVQDEAE